jgi:hypothetical protein
MGLSFSQLASSGVVLERHLSVKAAAETFGYNEQYLRRMLRAGRHPAAIVEIPAMDHRVHLSVQGWLQSSIQVGEKVVSPAAALNPRPKR